MKPITFITSNQHKLMQTQKYLQASVEHIAIDLPEIQSLNPLEIAECKAKEAHQKVKKPVLVEDTSLTIHALGKLPGPFIKWFLDELKPEGICRLLDPYEDKSATAWIIFAYHDGTSVHIFDIKQKGFITDHPRGENGFGWNVLFIPEGEKKTLAQMNDQEKDNISMRRRALKKLELYLNTK